MKKSSLKYGVFAACAVVAEMCFAAIDIGAMPHWVYADTEVSTNFPLRLARNPAEDLRFSLEFLSCESNNVEVAFGLDANTNGVLDVSERGLSVGWDCGEWFIRSLGEEPFLCDAATTNEEKRLDFAMHVSGYRAKRFAATENDVPLEWEMEGALPAWMFDPRWNMVRLMARGAEGSCDSFRAAVTIDAMKIRIR